MRGGWSLQVSKPFLASTLIAARSRLTAVRLEVRMAFADPVKAEAIAAATYRLIGGAANMLEALWAFRQAHTASSISLVRRVKT